MSRPASWRRSSRTSSCCSAPPATWPAQAAARAAPPATGRAAARVPDHRHVPRRPRRRRLPQPRPAGLRGVRQPHGHATSSGRRSASTLRFVCQAAGRRPWPRRSSEAEDELGHEPPPAALPERAAQGGPGRGRRCSPTPTSSSGRGSSWRSRSGRTCAAPRRSTPRCTRRSRSGRSSASTTSSARRRPRTSSPSASPTACSSRSGTASTSTTCRSTCPRRSSLDQRVGFYESTGAYRDMVVTHLFQVLAFMAMEPPTALDPHGHHRGEEQGLPLDAADRAGRRGARPVRRLPRRGGRVAVLRHRDVHRPALPDRQLALGRRAVLPAHGQAHGRGRPDHLPGVPRAAQEHVPARYGAQALAVVRPRRRRRACRPRRARPPCPATFSPGPGSTAGGSVESVPGAMVSSAVPTPSVAAVSVCGVSPWRQRCRPRRRSRTRRPSWRRLRPVGCIIIVVAAAACDGDEREDRQRCEQRRSAPGSEHGSPGRCGDGGTPGPMSRRRRGATDDWRRRRPPSLDWPPLAVVRPAHRREPGVRVGSHPPTNLPAPRDQPVGRGAP